MRVVWKHLRLPDPTPLQLDICDWLQFGPSKSITMAFRGCGKSYLTSAYACWSLMMDPQEIILVVSAGKERADLFTKFTRRLIEEIPILHPLRPNILRGDMDSAVSFQVGCCTPQQSPSVSSKGITGQITGSRGTLIIADDIEVPNNSATPAMREKLATSVEEFSAILVPATEKIKPRIRVLGTPQSEMTVYQTLESKGYIARIWPIEFPDESRESSYRGRLSPKFSGVGHKAGDPTEPDRFPSTEILSRRMEFGKAGYCLQFLLDTSLSDKERYPLKLHDLIVDEFDSQGAREVYVHSNHPRAKLIQFDNPGLDGDGFYGPGDVYGNIVKFDTTVLAVDPSGRGVDETAVSGVGAHSGYVFVHSCFGLQGGYEDHVLEIIAREAKRIRASKIVVESNFGDGMFARLLRPVVQRIYPCSIEEVKQSKQKEVRIIETLEPVMAGHRMIVHPSVIERDARGRQEETQERQRARQLFHQMTRISKDKGCLMHDDRLDALAIAVEALAETMSRNALNEARQREDDELPTTAATGTWLDSHDSISPLFSFL